MKPGYLAITLCLVCSLARAAESELPRAEVEKTLRIERTTQAPEIDGQLDDAVWQTAAKIDELYQVQPDPGALASERTDVYFAYDDDYLYIGAKLWDPGSPDELIATTIKHGAPLRDDDRLVILLDPFNSRRMSYRFVTNPYGIRHEVLSSGLVNNPDWSTIWETAGKAYEGYWVAEMAVPFKSLPFDARSDTWGLNVSRAIRRRNEEAAWVSRNRAWGTGITGTLTGLSGMKQGKGLDVVPGLTAARRTDRPGRREFTTVVPTLDAYYRLTPSLNASLTLNTDFSATEVDDRQVNLSRFGLFFPEKREFFLNDGELFDFARIGAANSDGANNTAIGRPSLENGKPFFSRRLGLSPTGVPVDILYGGKLSGRAGDWNIGALAIQQDDFQLPAGALLAPKAAVVARISRNVLGESSIGGMFTSGNTQSNDSNTLFGADFNYRDTRAWNNRPLQGELWVQRTRTALLRGRDAALGLGISVPANEGWRGALSARELQENFNPALGYVNVRGVRQYALDVGYNGFPQNSRLYNWYIGVDLFRLDALQSGLLSEQLTLRLPELANELDDRLTVAATRNRENVAQPFTLYSDGVRVIDVPTGDYAFNEWSVSFDSGRSRATIGSLTITQGDFYDGRHAELNGSVIWKPSRHFSLALNANWNRIELPRGRFISRLARLSTEIGFSPSVGLSTSLQYDNSSELLGAQARFYWIPEAGQKFSLVFNHAMQDPDRNRHFTPTVSELSARASYTLRF